MLAEVIAIGDELTSGQRLDTNSQWLSRELGLLGIPTGYHTTVCDTLEAGVEAFTAAARRTQVVLATGGLGPTADDLTRDVLAAVAGVDPSEGARILEQAGDLKTALVMTKRAVSVETARRLLSDHDGNVRRAIQA